MIQALCGFFPCLSYSFTEYVTVVFVFHADPWPLFMVIPYCILSNYLHSLFSLTLQSQPETLSLFSALLASLAAVSSVMSWSWLFYSSSSDQFGASIATPVLQHSALATLTTKVITWTVLGLVLPLVKRHILLCCALLTHSTHMRNRRTLTYRMVFQCF